MASHQSLLRHKLSVLNAEVHKIRSTLQRSTINTDILSTVTLIEEVRRNSAPIHQTKWCTAVLQVCRLCHCADYSFSTRVSVLVELCYTVL